jgi:hypothetical protein
MIRRLNITGMTHNSIAAMNMAPILFTFRGEFSTIIITSLQS